MQAAAHFCRQLAQLPDSLAGSIDWKRATSGRGKGRKEEGAGGGTEEWSVGEASAGGEERRGGAGGGEATPPVKVIGQMSEVDAPSSKKTSSDGSARARAHAPVAAGGLGREAGGQTSTDSAAHADAPTLTDARAILRRLAAVKALFGPAPTTAVGLQACSVAWCERGEECGYAVSGGVAGREWVPGDAAECWLQEEGGGGGEGQGYEGCANEQSQCGMRRFEASAPWWRERERETKRDEGE